MVRSCCAPGCTQRDTASSRKNNITFHRFPLKNSVKLKKWMQAVDRQDLKNGVPWTPTVNSCLCSSHFTAKSFDRTGQTVRLKDHAVPSVFPSGPQTKISALRIHPSHQENDSIRPPVIALDHLYHLPSNSIEGKNKEKPKNLVDSEAEQQETPLSIDEEHNSSSIFPELTPERIRLYCHKLCPFSHRVRLVMEHKKIRYETVEINLKSKPDWFLQRNPYGLVPVLEHDDKIIYESLVCNDYLDDVYLDPHLQPADPYLRAKDKMLIGQFDKDIKLATHSISGGSEKELRQKLIYHSQILEKELEMRGDYFGGTCVGMLDFNLWPWFESLGESENLKGLIHDLPTKLSAWKTRMWQEPAVQAIILDLQQHAQFLKSLLAQKENKT